MGFWQRPFIFFASWIYDPQRKRHSLTAFFKFDLKLHRKYFPQYCSVRIIRSKKLCLIMLNLLDFRKFFVGEKFTKMIELQNFRGQFVPCRILWL